MMTFASTPLRTALIRRSLAGLAVAVTAVAGCTASDPGSPTAGAGQPVPLAVEQSPALQVARVDPSLRGQRYSVLLNFELPQDDAFVVAEPAGDRSAVAIDADRAMTGKASLKVAPAAKAVTVKLGSLLTGREFPATWTLLGGSVYADKPATATITLTLEDGRTLTRVQPVEPGRWSAAWLDITALPPDAAARPATLTFEFAGKTDVWIDDVLMTDNSAWLVGASPADEPWSIARRGYVVYVESPDKFRMRLDTLAGKANGWTLDEVGPARLRLSSQGQTKFLTVYSDGRSYWDGEPRPLSPQARSEPIDQHRSPAEILVPEEMGRLNRNTPGDLNNDGYNERVGAYQVTAAGARVDVTISPRSAALVRPVIEIAGLPAEGKPLATIEGRLVDATHLARTPDGRLLVMLPFRIDRTTTVNVRVTGG